MGRPKEKSHSALWLSEVRFREMPTRLADGLGLGSVLRLVTDSPLKALPSVGPPFSASHAEIRLCSNATPVTRRCQVTYFSTLHFALIHSILHRMAFDLIVNGTRHTVDADPQTPLLWVIRDHVGLTGTKFSCGIGQCGACTLHVDGRPIRSCSVPAATAVGKSILTIEGLSPEGRHPIQVAWIELDAPQCGYCQSGMIMSTLALLQKHPNPSDAEIDAEVTNACRCSTYHRIRKAIHLAADLMKVQA